MILLWVLYTKVTFLITQLLIIGQMMIKMLLMYRQSNIYQLIESDIYYNLKHLNIDNENLTYTLTLNDKKTHYI